MERQVMRKIVTRLMPALLVLYVIAYLDRVNVTFAQDRLEEDLGFSGAVYGFGAGIFFIGYFLLEVPSNLAMVVNVYGLSFWVGEMVDQINGVSDVAKGFITAVPYAVAIVGMVVIPRY